MIVIADDIMIVGKQQNHRDHDVALTTLLETARKCNVKLNFDKLQYKKTEVDVFGETYTTSGFKPAQSKVSVIVKMPAPSCKKQVQSFIGMVNYFSNFWWDCLSLWSPLENSLRIKYPSSRYLNIKRHSTKWRERLQEPPYLHITIQEKKQSYKHMQA